MPGARKRSEMILSFGSLKKEYLEMNPTHALVIAEMEENEDKEFEEALM
jgi:hypothetical protein